jgi:hypothetical protein
MDKTCESIYQGKPLIAVGSTAWVIHSSNLVNGPNVGTARVSKIEITPNGVYYLLHGDDNNVTYTKSANHVFGDRDAAYMAALGCMHEACHQQLEQAEKAISEKKEELEELLKIRERINSMMTSMPWRDN